MFRYTRLSNENDIVRFGFEFAYMSVGATYYGHQDWTLDKKNQGNGIRRPCVTAPADINFHLPHADLRKDKGCLFEKS